MQHEILLIGLNHKTAGVDVREKFALTSVDDFESALVCGPVAEALALSTCNRVEILAIGEDRAAVEAHVLNAWAGACGQSAESLRPHVYVHHGVKAVRHVFRVAGSLDSMVLGEPQILGQLKDAYRKAVEHGVARTIVSRLLHKSFFVAKRVRTETAVAGSAVSISYAAVELAKKIFGDLADKTAMLVGAGEMAELAATHLLNSGIKHVYVCNRTFSRAEELAAQYRGTAVHFEKLYDTLPEVDIIISSTGSPNAVIMARDVKRILKLRKYRPMFFIDIAVPRDIDPDVNQLDGVYLYDIDDLKDVVEENLAQRRDEAVKAEEIVAEEVASFADWLRSLDLQPTIVDLFSSGEEIARRELAKTLKRLGPAATPEVAGCLEFLATSIAKKLYHEPIVFLKRRTQEDGASDKWIDVTRRMFNLDKDNVPEDAHASRKPLRLLRAAQGAECSAPEDSDND